ncbi:hypothetical protein CDEF62S_04655 [Castellaniella defragrans]
MDAEAIDVATRLSAWESLRGGFTTVVDAGTRASVDVEIDAQAASPSGPEPLPPALIVRASTSR